MKKRPNIVIFNPDQFRADALHHLGNPASVTPNLDRLAQEDGISLRNAFCQNPVCTPSRCSFMSGWYPHVRGHRTMYYMMHSDEPVLLRTLKKNGYFVWWGGKNDLIPGQESDESCCHVRYTHPKGMEIAPNPHATAEQWRGKPGDDNYYSFYCGELPRDEKTGRYYDEDWGFVDGAVDFINSWNEDKPFCLYLPLLYPHPPYAVEEPWYSITDRSRIPDAIPVPENDWAGLPSMLRGIYQRQGLQEWTEERFRELRGTYLGMCSRIDYQFGMIMDALKKSGQYDNTAVFFFSDHGDFTGDYGLVEKTQNTFEDCLTNVPFLFKPPAEYPVKPGIRDALAELVDFSATVEQLTGIQPEHTHFGRSILPLAEGKTDCHRDAVFCEGGRFMGEVQCMERESVAQREPTGLYWPRASLQQTEGPEHGKGVMCRTERYKYVKRAYDPDELYDLEKDPRELHNIIDDPAYGEILEKLKLRMLDFFFETSDVVPMKTDRR